MLLRTIRQIMQRRIFLHEQKIADLEKSMKLRATITKLSKLIK